MFTIGTRTPKPLNHKTRKNSKIGNIRERFKDGYSFKH